MEHLPPHRREHMLEPESSQTIGEESGEQADNDEIQLEPTDIEARREEAQNALPEEAADVEYPPAVSESVSREDETPPEQREPEQPTPAEREPEDTPEPPLEEPDEQQPEGDPQPDQPGQQLHQNSAKKESEDEL